MQRRLLLSSLVIASLITGLLILPPLFSSEGGSTFDYETAVAEHAYWRHHGMSEEELKALPKADRPDLAILLDHMLTMDPTTGDVPRERLFAANRIATASKRGGGGSILTEEWEERGPTNVGGRTRALMFDPNDPAQLKVWAAGVAGGVWYTEDISDPGEEWVAVDDFWANLAVSTLAYDATDTNVFYAGTGEGWFNADAVRGAGIFKSEDGGETWDLLPSTETSTFHYVQDILVHPATGDVYAATFNGGVQRSQDGGQTWVRVLGGGAGATNNRAADLELGADGTLYASLGIFNLGTIYSSETGDPMDWTLLSTPESGFPTAGILRIELATAPSDENVLYAITHQAANNGIGGIYRSDDKGVTWTSLPLPSHPQFGDDFSNGQAWYDLIAKVNPDDADIVYIGAVDLFMSMDGGASWSLISSAYGLPGEPYVHADQHGIFFRPGSSDEVVFSHDGGLDYSTNASEAQPSYLNRNNGYNVTQFYSAALHPDAGSNVMLAGSQDNGTQRFSASGLGSTTRVYGGDGGFTFIDQDQPAAAIASYVYNRFYRSLNGGITFPTTLLNEATGLFINPADYDDREDILYTAYISGGTRGFNRVSAVRTSQPQTTRVTAVLAGSPTHLRVSPHAPDSTSTLFIGTSSGRVYKVTDAHSDDYVIEELERSGLPSGTISSIEIGPTEDQLLVTYSNYGVTSVWETLDGGATWHNREGNLPDMPIRWALYHPETPGAALLATEAGVWETTNLGSPAPTWTPSPSFPTVRVDMLQWRLSDNLVMASTHGRGVYTAFFRSGLVANEPGTAAPTSHELGAAYPNPFADRTTFTLTLEEPQRVRVEVYNTVGQRVAVLHDGALGAGTPHRFTLEGNGLASGTYLYTVTGERFRESGRVTLAR